MSRLFAWLVLPVALLALGFVGFVVGTTHAPATQAHAAGIVVLTGGADRVQTGLRLLAEGRAPRLLISGVGQGIDYHTLARMDGARPGLSHRVTLGYRAKTTSGNAREAARWAARDRLRSVIVVTAFYHMPRALAEFSRAMPGVALHAYPVHPPSLRPWWRFAAVWRLLAVEYVKYLAVVSGVAPLLHLDR